MNGHSHSTDYHTHTQENDALNGYDYLITSEITQSDQSCTIGSHDTCLFQVPAVLSFCLKACKSIDYIYIYNTNTSCH
jgi:hypothetical protein